MKPMQWATFSLAILFAAFFTLFAIVALPELTSFGIMLVPSILILSSLLLGLHKPLWGAITYFTLGIAAFFFFASYKSYVQFLIVDFPFFVLAGIFLWQYLKEK